MVNPERFWAKVNKTDACWLWTGRLDTHGYGEVRTGGMKRRRFHRAHRVAYELLVGPIPDGLVIDHLCRVRNCVNPEHLEPVTNAENIRRGETGRARGAQQRAKTHCAQGHPYDETNTYHRPQGGRDCRLCMHARKQRFEARRRAA